jgi:hypothetical protein
MGPHQEHDKGEEVSDGSKLTLEGFLENVKNHKLRVIKDDGLYRHIRLAAPGTSNQYFDIVTWPGYLSYVGDMGDFIFERIEDMFCFFRSEKGKIEINTSYWSEKVKAESVFGGGIREFSVESFRENIRDHVRMIFDLEEGQDLPENIQEEIDPLLSAEDEWECVAAMRDFSSDKIDFSDFWEASPNRKTLAFVWCCYAITWAISQYDAFKENLATFPPHDSDGKTA